MKLCCQGPIVILGAGPTGLGAAYLCERLGFANWVLYERSSEVGGLSRSVRDRRGFTWDIGGHVAFSHYGLYSRLLDELLGPDGWIEHQRESWIRLLGTWVPYPFQNNLHRLPPAERAECLEGLIRAALARRDGGFAHFDDFVQRTFGPGIARLFMRPYNFKVWAHHPEQLDAGWIAERVAVPDAARVARNVALGADDVAWGPNSTFRFPKRGGTGAVWRALARRLPGEKLVTGCGAVAVDPDRRVVQFADGSSRPYEVLISTLPLDRLAAMTGRRDWTEAAAGLTHSATHVIGVGLRGNAPQELATKCWMYFPEDNCPFYRVTHFSLYSPNNVPDVRREWSLMCEVSASAEKPVDDERVVRETLDGLVAAGLIESAEQVFHTWKLRGEYGYPVPTPPRDAILDELLPAMYERGILSRGRFGAWRYEVSNMDHSLMQGVEAAAHVLTGSPELTVWDPGFVNTRHPVLGWDRVFCRGPGGADPPCFPPAVPDGPPLRKAA